MEWCKLYASLPRDRDLRRAGEAATLLFVFALCYCADEETDGFVADDALPDFRLPRATQRAAALVRVGVWDRVSDGYVIPGWKEKQKELYAIMEKRRKDAARVARKRKESRDGRATDGTSLSTGAKSDRRSPARVALLYSQVTGPDKLGQPQVSASLSRDSREKVAVESREEKNPPTPRQAGGSCAKHRDEPHPDCRGCGTNRRAVQKAARIAAVPDWCGECDEGSRLVEVNGGDAMARCPRCNPQIVVTA